MSVVGMCVAVTSSVATKRKHLSLKMAVYIACASIISALFLFALAAPIACIIHEFYEKK